MALLMHKSDFQAQEQNRVLDSLQRPFQAAQNIYFKGKYSLLRPCD